MNYVTVENILSLDIAKDCEVVAGEGGLGKMVSWIYICQENEIAPWIQGRELMILYGSGVKRDTPNLVRIVEICAEQQISAILVLIGHYFIELPQEMLDAADKYGVPLITMPATVPISSLTKAVATMLLSEKHYVRRSADTLRDIIYGYDEDEHSHFNAIERAGYKLRKNLYIAVLWDSQRRLCDYPDTQHIINDVCRILNTPIVYIQKNRIVALVGRDKPDTADYLTECGREILLSLDSEYGLSEMYFALGSAVTDKNSIKTSYRDAVNTVKSIRIFDNATKCKKYDDVPAILKMMFRAESIDFIKNCYEPTLGGILEYDREHNAELMNTLLHFFEENCNASRAAEKLYIHRNTMNNRLRLIFDILGTDCSDAVSRFFVENALYCYKYIVMQDEQK